MERRGGHGGVLKARSCTVQQRSPCLCIRGEQERGGRKGRGGSCKTAAAALVQRDIKPLSSPWWGARPATSRHQATACAPPPAPPILRDPSRASLPPARQHPRVRVGLGVHPPDTHDGAGRPQHLPPPPPAAVAASAAAASAPVLRRGRVWRRPPPGGTRPAPAAAAASAALSAPAPGGRPPRRPPPPTAAHTASAVAATSTAPGASAAVPA